MPLLGTDPGRCSNQTSLETVHDKLHVTIGGPTGWMSDPTAAGEAPDTPCAGSILDVNTHVLNLLCLTHTRLPRFMGPHPAGVHVGCRL